MSKQYRFLLGAVLAVVLSLLLWGAVAVQFGTVGNGVRYLQGYNYVVSPTAIDVGEGATGEKRTAQIAVRNLSFSPIRIIGAVTTCNCLAPKDLPLNIAPRETADLHFTIYLESANGQVEQIATLLIDDGGMQSTPVVITGMCIPRRKNAML